jgi:hypothetical protein
MFFGVVRPHTAATVTFVHHATETWYTGGAQGYVDYPPAA